MKMFKPVFIEGTTLGDTYFQLLYNLWKDGRKTKITEGSNKGGYRIEFDFCSGIIQFPHIRPLAPIFPEGIPATTTDEVIEQYFPNYLMNDILSKKEHYKYADWINSIKHYSEFKFLIDFVEPEFGPVFKENKETPIEWIIRHYKEKGYGNNHCYINVGNVDSNFNYDIPYKNETDRMTSPCLRGIDFKIINNELLVHVTFRSWDMYSGWPENMGGFTLLNEYVANELQIEPGPLSFTCAKLHAYDYQIKPILQILHKEELNNE